MTTSFNRHPPHYFVHPLLCARDWQDRPELDHLCDWWRGVGKGVCALVGIGGAGKTAVVQRFLRVLPGVLPLELGLRKDKTLRKPARLFVYSFYDAPNPDDFFARLGAWLSDSMDCEPGRLPSYEQTVGRLACAGQCLLVLDGLEKVQEDGLRGDPFGQLSDGRLRDFILRVAEGRLSEVAVLITTRFALHDLQARPALNFRAITVDRISEAACIALLRRRGVQGSDEELARIARDCGHHALTVDLAGGYIGHFAAGDPARAAEFTRRDEGAPRPAPSFDERLRLVAEQTARFERVALRYREALAQTDPATLALLERVCLFRVGVDANLLALVFTGPGKATIAGAALAALTPEGVEARLERLVDLRLLEAVRREIRHTRRHGPETAPGRGLFSGRGCVIYSIHPAVRDGFLKGLDPEVARQGHAAAREGMIASLGGLPGRDTYPSDPDMLDLLEEVCYHTLEAGHGDAAWDLYRYLLGGYENLGWRLGAYERGERICRVFAGGRVAESGPLPEWLSRGNHAVFLNEWALYLSDLGRLGAAALGYQRNIALRVGQRSWRNASIGWQNLADLHLLAGRLPEGLRTAQEALRLADLAPRTGEQKDSLAYRGHALGLLGRTREALADFDAALQHQHREEGPAAPLYRLRGVQHAWLLVRLGRHHEARRSVMENREILLRRFGPDYHHLPRCELLLAAVARAGADLATAREHLRAARDWAVARDAPEVLCWSACEQAAIALTDARRKADGPFGPETKRCLTEARHAAEDGLRIARTCGFGIFHIDLLLLRAQVALEERDPEAVGCDVRAVLEEGYCPAPQSGLPRLPAAAEPACGYTWGVTLGRQLLDQVRLL